MALPQDWGSVAGFKHLKDKTLAKYHWYPVRDDSIVGEGDKYTMMFLPEHGIVIKTPADTETYRGGQTYAITQLYRMFEFFTTLAFYSTVLGEVYKFPNAACEHVHRQNCLMSGEDYSCLAEGPHKKFERVTVPHQRIKSLIEDAASIHNQQLEKLLAGVDDITHASDAELQALMDTNFADYYG